MSKNTVTKKECGASIGAKVANEFRLQCKASGFRKNAALEAAITLWLSLPVTKKAELMAAGAQGS